MRVRVVEGMPGDFEAHAMLALVRSPFEWIPLEANHRLLPIVAPIM
jgi:hypothetical protein